MMMEAVILDILNELRAVDALDGERLAKIVRSHNKNRSSEEHYSKKRLLPYYLKVKELAPERWASWDVSPELDRQLLALLQVKPRRTASGVATITVITKPWQCSSDCLYCPSDLRMPKSYLSAEPACQRAELNYFDPYLQAASRLYVLEQMGHVTDKIELIILGGTWSDYPESYQIWFVAELFKALNDSNDVREQKAQTLRAFYASNGISNSKPALADLVHKQQQEIDSGSLTYNQAIEQLYGAGSIWQSIATEQKAELSELLERHKINETAQHKVVGLVVETRPDLITSKSLTLLRRLGCTKIQMGIQSLDPVILVANSRNITLEKIQEAFELLRIFGFKIHAHFMLNLYGATVEADKQDYLRFVTEQPYQPDEVKLYPCALVNGAKLNKHYASGSWRPYTEAELLDVLIANSVNTPPFIRISRMIRDICAGDIVAGNKKSNLRQMVELQAAEAGKLITEIRQREISTGDPDVDSLALDTISYETTATNEYFLQWVTPENKIAGFLRLSLPKPDYLLEHQAALPIALGEAMIREVHIYGRVAELQKGDAPKASSSTQAQHLGLGKQLIAEACVLAKAYGYNKLNVVSSVGTRAYYRNLGFNDGSLYQQKALQ